MSTAERPATTPPLLEGQRMGRAEFHERYKEAPPGLHFELIEGVVCMASPVGPRHGRRGFSVAGWLHNYVWQTPGVEGHDNSSVALDDRNEVQPDFFLRVEEDCGGRSRDLGRIISGPPELVVEIADSSRTIDLGSKRSIYEDAGCPEYLVMTLQPLDIHWHMRRDGSLVRVEPGSDGIYRSDAFPGLWLDSVALLAGDIRRVMATLQLGLAAPEHAAFVARLGLRD